jgi:hypothetical protein
VHNLVVVVSIKSHNIVTQDAIGMMALLSTLFLALNLDLMKDGTHTEVTRSSSGRLDQMLLLQKWQGWMEMLPSQQLRPRMASEKSHQIHNNNSLGLLQVSVLKNESSSFEIQCENVLHLVKFHVTELKSYLWFRRFN